MSKRLWIFLLIATGSLALWRGTVGGMTLWNYEQLSESTPGIVEKVEVVPKGSKYALQVTYSYDYRGKAYAKRMLLAKPYYLNRISAERAAQNLSGMDSTVYLNPKYPQFSTIEAQFPLRDLLYGACLVGVFLYFVYLRIHLELLSKAM